MAIQKWSDDTLVVRLSDDPALSDDFDEISDRLAGGEMDIVLDLSDLTLLTSSGISKLLRLRKGQLESKRQLILCCPRDAVWSVFLATGLDTLFEFNESVSDSLARLQTRKSR
jgi:anti-anti-sigma factor